MPKLTERQRAFCRHLVTGMSASEAAREAGYRNAGRQAYELLEKPHIKAEIDRLREKVEDKALVTVEDVIRGLLHEAENAATDGPRVTAWTNLGKYLGMFTDKHEVTLRKHPSAMTDDELDAALRDAGLL